MYGLFILQLHHHDPLVQALLEVKRIGENREGSGKSIVWCGVLLTCTLWSGTVLFWRHGASIVSDWHTASAKEAGGVAGQ
jgi:hypothetical protein